MFENGFPQSLVEEEKVVSALISKATYRNIPRGKSEDHCKWLLLEGETICFPRRIYYLDDYDAIKDGLSPIQQFIYHCIFSRSNDGFIRQRHIREILSGDIPSWAMPYIVKVCDEYVMEILEDVYAALKDCDNAQLHQICERNWPTFLRSHDRMISYWNEFYRDRCYHYKDYVGRSLFAECFGYTRSMEKLRHKTGEGESQALDAPLLKLKITSPAFKEGGWIPLEYTARGGNISPKLHITGVDKRAVSLAITMDDASHPLFSNYNHWVIWNVPVQEWVPAALPAGNCIPALPGAVQGMAYGRQKYKGPKPPLKSIHTYTFTVYALDCELSLPSTGRRKDLFQQIEGHILQKATLSGKFQSWRKQEKYRCIRTGPSQGWNMTKDTGMGRFGAKTGDASIKLYRRK